MTNKIFKKKIRWTFHGFDASLNESFPECFVKVSHRPDFPYMVCASEDGGVKVPVPSEMRLTQHFTMYDKKNQARSEFDKINMKATDTHKGILKMWDGTGLLIEKWELLSVSMILEPSIDTSDDDNIIAEWIVAYKDSKWINHSEFKIGGKEKHVKTQGQC